MKQEKQAKRELESPSSALPYAIEYGKSGIVNEFLWSCAGVNKAVLRQCPSDYAKYAGIGGTILFTALMAAISGGYALNFVFDNVNIAIAFGIFWGLLIFNLDRFIVNTMYSDGKPSISWPELRSGLPRIIMAIFLGIVISTPLEMKIFEDRINSQMVLDNIERTNETRVAAEQGNDELRKRRDELEKQHSELKAEQAKAEQDLKREIVGEGPNGKPGKGPYYEAKKEYLDQINVRLNKWETDNAAELQSIKQQLAHNTAKANGEIERGNSENGFAVRYAAFRRITDWKNNTSLALVSLMITLLFVIIETAPSFFKMMMSSGPYDDLLHSESQRVKTLSLKRVSDINDECNTSIKISTMKNQKRLEAETIANENIMKRLAEVQAELLSMSIEVWREQELKKIQETPSAYIHTNVNTGSGE